MAFQSTVRQFMTDGIVGDIALDGAVRSQPGVLKTADPTNNVIGRAVTSVAGVGNDYQFVAGGTGVFAGILTNSKQYALTGGSSGTLSPTLTLPNNMPVEATYMATGVWVTLAGAANIGDQVAFVQADGSLLSLAPGASAGAGQTIIAGAKVIRQSTSTAGLAMISLLQ